MGVEVDLEAGPARVLVPTPTTTAWRRARIGTDFEAGWVSR